VYIPGLIGDTLMENGKIIKWMEKVFSLGLMDANIQDNIEMIKRKAMEFSNGIFKIK